jgi:hypothetical protein
MPTMNKITPTAFRDSTSVSELKSKFSSKSNLVASSSHVRTKAVSVRSMLNETWLAAGTSRSICIAISSGSICTRIVLLLLQLLASVADVRTHILDDHIHQPFKITIKTEESSNDDDDG